MPPSAGACHTTDASLKPDCGRASGWSSIITAIGWRLAAAGVTSRPVIGAATGLGVGLGVGVGVGVGSGVAVGSGVGVAVGAVVGVGDAEGETSACALGLGAAAPAAITPAPTPAMAASPSAPTRTIFPDQFGAVATCPLERPLSAGAIGALSRTAAG